jgi:hypothetical protein
VGIREVGCPLVRWDSHDGRTAVSPTSLPVRASAERLAPLKIGTAQYPATDGLTRLVALGC